MKSLTIAIAVIALSCTGAATALAIDLTVDKGVARQATRLAITESLWSGGRIGRCVQQMSKRVACRVTLTAHRYDGWSRECRTWAISRYVTWYEGYYVKAKIKKPRHCRWYRRG